MKINEIILENLGTLAQLNAGPLINVLRQSKDSDFSVGPNAKKFQSPFIGSTSPVVDAGEIKGGLAGLRKAYKKAESQGLAQAFAIYLGGKAVAVGSFDSYSLGGSTRTALFAWELKDFASDINNKIPTSSYKERQPYRDPSNPSDALKKPFAYQGEATSVKELKIFLDHLDTIAQSKGLAVTAKLVLRDNIARTKRDKRRLTRSEINKGTDDLRARLKNYKLSKNPKVSSIEEFIKLSLNGAGKQVQFGGYSYSFDKFNGAGLGGDVALLLRGDSFDVNYRSVDPGAGSWTKVTIKYALNLETMTLEPIWAQWYDRENTRESQQVILNGKMYIKDRHGINDINNKKEVITRLLTLVKSMAEGNRESGLSAETLVDLVKKSNNDWPEIGIIEKTIAADYRQRETA